MLQAQDSDDSADESLDRSDSFESAASEADRWGREGEKQGGSAVWQRGRGVLWHCRKGGVMPQP